MPKRRQHEPDLLAEVEESLRDPHPIRLLGLASALLAATEPQPDHLRDRRRGGPERIELAPLMDAFLGSGDRSMLNLVAVMARLQSDQLLRARVMRSVDDRELLPWIRDLGEMSVTAACVTIDRLRDTANVVLECRLSEHVMCVVVLIDFNQGAVAKDGFIIDGPLSDYQQLWRELETSGGTEMFELSPADARIQVTDAIERRGDELAAVRDRELAASPAAGAVGPRSVPHRGTGTGPARVERCRTASKLGAAFLSSPWGRPYLHRPGRLGAVGCVDRLRRRSDLRRSVVDQSGQRGSDLAVVGAGHLVGPAVDPGVTAGAALRVRGSSPTTAPGCRPWTPEKRST